MAEQEKVVPKADPGKDNAVQNRVRELEGENERLRRELAESKNDQRLSRGHSSRPFLSEGERADLEFYGATNSPFTGERLTAEGEGVETKREADALELPPTRTGSRGAVEGFDYVYPSVAPRVLDPKLTGEPVGKKVDEGDGF
jgi:hypothetical protein